MKKLLLMAMLAMLAISVVFAKNDGLPADRFFGKDVYAAGGTVYKITNIQLHISPKKKVELIIHGEHYQWKSLTKFLTNDEISRIEKAEQYEVFKKNYIIYVYQEINPFSSDHSYTPIRELNKLIIDRIENIPTEEDFAAEIRRPEEERLAAEQVKERKIKVEKEGGYDNLPWGTPISDFFSLNPDAKIDGDEGSLVVYSKDGTIKDSKIIYKFLDEKLVAGVTRYKNVDEKTGDAINHRLVELYGNKTSGKDSKEHKVRTVLGTRISYTEYHIKPVWDISPTFRVTLDIRILEGDTKTDNFNIYMFIDTSRITFTISYDNPAMAQKISAADAKAKREQEAAQKAQEEADLRKRMDSLGL